MCKVLFNSLTKFPFKYNCLHSINSINEKIINKNVYAFVIIPNLLIFLYSISNVVFKSLSNMKIPSFIQKPFTFYRDGFRGMTVGKTLWILILIKLFIMFAVLRIFFFPNYLKTNFKDDQSRANHVRQELIERRK